MSSKDPQINEEIRDKELRVVSDEGEQLGIMSADQALALADEQNKDLVKIAPQAKPPVVKIMDYGKYRYEISKREKEAKKSQKVVEMKELRLSVNIDVGDFDTRAKRARKFLLQGNKVKVVIRFRGRQLAHTELGLEPMGRFVEALADISTVETKPKLEGRMMFMVLAPKKD